LKVLRKGLLAGVLAAVAIVASPAAASAADRYVAIGGIDAANDCLNPLAPCGTIQRGVSQAAVNDTVNVGPGTFATEPNNQVLIDKGLLLQGAGIDQTILDGNRGTTLAATGTLRVSTNTADPVTVTGLTIQNAGSVGVASASVPRYAIRAQGLGNAATPAAYTFTGIKVVGTGDRGIGNNGFDYGLYAVGSTAQLEVADSDFSDTDNNPILLERQQGPADIHGNVISKAPLTSAGAIFSMNYQPGTPGNAAGIAAPQTVHDNVIDASGFSGVAFSAAPSFVGTTTGSYQSVTVADNQISGLGATQPGISITNQSTAANGLGAVISAATVTGNVVEGPGGSGLGVQGLVNGLTVSGNEILGMTRSVQIRPAAAGHQPPTAAVNFNRLIGATGVDNDATTAINAENNWWGCNAGPGGTGCSAVTGPAVDRNPWLVLRVAATPSSLSTGGSNAAVVAGIDRNSDGVTPAPNTLPEQTLSFGASLGAISPPAQLTNAHLATATYTSGPVAGSGAATATLDNETATAPITLTGPAAAIPGIEGPSGSLVLIKVKKKKRKGTARLTVAVPAAGATRLRGPRIRTRSRVSASAGNLTLSVKARGKAKKKLTRTGKARVRVNVTFAPNAGPVQTLRLKVRLRKRS
jgi:hypothetical protein